MISRCPGDQTSNDCNQVSVRAASESLRVVFVLSVVISVCLPVSVSAQGFLFLQVTDHIPLHLLQSLLQQVFPGNLPDRFPHPLWFTQYTLRQRGLLMLAVSHRLYRAEDRAERLALVACLLAVIPALNLATSDAAAVAGLVMTVLTVGLVSCAGKSLPRFWPGDFFPTFYACHLAVLGVLAL